MPGGKLSGLGAGLHIPDLIETADSNPSRVNSDAIVIFWIAEHQTAYCSLTNL